jgi:uncharacterized membrane protein
VGADEAEEAVAGKGESRWPVLIGMVVAISLPLLLPDRFVPGPPWLLPAIQLLFVVAFALLDPGRIDRRSQATRRVRLGFILLLVLGATSATIALTSDLLKGGPDTQSASTLLATGALVWLDTIITFGFLYWELDSGGPGERAHETRTHPDLAFPQHMNPQLAPPGWRPVYPDYAYLGMTNALAFSPTDVMPLTHWPKLAMAAQSMISMLILGLVVANAVNLLN